MPYSYVIIREVLGRNLARKKKSFPLTAEIPPYIIYSFFKALLSEGRSVPLSDEKKVEKELRG